MNWTLEVVVVPVSGVDHDTDPDGNGWAVPQISVRAASGSGDGR